jgi:hypothetical protein
VNTNKIKLSFAPGLEIEFVDRERALKQVEELAEKGTSSRWLSSGLKVVAKLHG